MKRFVHVFSEREASFTEWLYKIYQEVRAWADWGLVFTEDPLRAPPGLRRTFRILFALRQELTSATLR